MRGVYIGNGNMLVSTVWGGRLRVPAEDLSLAPELILEGSLELPLTRYLIQHLAPGSTVYDLGANLGYFTVLFGLLVGPEGRVVAYEPHPVLHDMLVDNVSLQYLHDRVTLHRQAVSSKDRTLTLYMSDRFLGNSSVKLHNEEYHRHYRDQISPVEVKAVALDSVVAGSEFIDFMKIDIEGGEYQALIGMTTLLSQGRVKRVVFEFNPGMLQEDLEPFRKWIVDQEASGAASFFLLNAEGHPVPMPTHHLLTHGNPHVILEWKR